MPRDSIPDSTEVLVIGGGPAGYVAAIRARQLDREVTLVEREALGGVCLNHGCIPSKALISATDIAHDAAEAESMGITAEPQIDLDRLIGWKDGVVEQLTGGVDKLCKANRVTVVSGTAKFSDSQAAIVESATDDKTAEIEFEHAIIATGSRPIELPGFEFEHEPIISSREALSPSSIPDSLLIVGAGYIGMELAGVYAKLGTEVTMVEMLDSILPGYESDLVRPVARRADGLGIDVHLERVATGWEATDDGQVVVETEPADGADDSAAAMTLTADRVLVAVGRAPVTDSVDLAAAGVETTEQGFVQTDETMRTTVDHIYAIGDVAGEPMLAHAGMAEGLVAAAAIAGETPNEWRAVPAAVFTDPEIGTVGMTVDEATAADLDPTVGEFPFRASGRALTTGRHDGFVRLVARGSDGVIVGGQVVGPEASELVAEIGLAIETEATLEDLGKTIHVHPTLGEAVMEAAEQGLGRAIHTLNR